MRLILKYSLFTFFYLTSNILLAQTNLDPSLPPGGGQQYDVPIDSKIWILLIIVTIFGIYQYRKNRAL